MSSQDADFSDAVKYHYGQFPPNNLSAAELLTPLSQAVSELTRYDVMLRQMRDSEILLSPLRRQEAVVSSRMEGTVTTLEEVLSVEADQESEEGGDSGAFRHEAVEVLSYSRAMRRAQIYMEDGKPISEFLIKSAHHILLMFGRGNHLSPGHYKKDQNYLADKRRKKILFIPISPEQLQPHMEKLLDYMNNVEEHPLIKAAVSHIEFEALHPFNDGNGRMGRMLITLYLWQSGVISAPHFYVSEYFEENRDEYIDRMRAVSQEGAWTEWVVFFLKGLAEQAARKCAEIEKIQQLYEDMRIRFHEVLSSKDYLAAVNFVFESPVFRSNRFTIKTGLSKPTATRFLRLLKDEGLLRVVQPGAGRRPTMYAFEPLLEALRE